MDKNTTFKYWLAVARHTSYKIGKQPRPAFVGGKQVPDNLNQLSIGQLIDLSQLSDSEGKSIPDSDNRPRSEPQGSGAG